MSISRPTASTRGFTLVEMLVVVAIIALLLSILLPSLSKAKEHAQFAVCGTANKQFVTGMLTYTTENKGKFLTGDTDSAASPTFNSKIEKTSQDSPFRARPVSFHIKYTFYLNDQDWMTSTSGGGALAQAYPPVYWDMIRKAGVFWCPTAPKDFPKKDDPGVRGWGWGTPVAVNGGFAPIPNHQQLIKSKNLDAVDNPALSILSADGHELGLRKGGWRTLPGSAYWGEYADPLFRHFPRDSVPERKDLASLEAGGQDVASISGGLGKSNFSMWDGSVQSMDEDVFINAVIDEQIKQNY